MTSIPENATLLGRVWNADAQGPSVVTIRDGQVIDITEFPYFTYLFGDLHPHMMGMTFVGLSIAIDASSIIPGLAWGKRRVSSRISSDIWATYSIVVPTP